MKKIVLLAGLVLLLSGCGTQPVLETVTDDYVQSVSAQTRQIALTLPENAAALAVQSDTMGNLYFCEGYTVTVQVWDSGDLDETLRQATGFGKDALHLVETAEGDTKRYDCVWACAGEGEDQVGRAAVLDDGVSHYVLTCMAGASQAEALQDQWQELFASFGLVNLDSQIRTGS